MDAEFTVESFRAYLQDLGSEDGGRTFCLTKASGFGAIRLHLNINPPSQETLDECLLVGLRNLGTQTQHISHVVAALQLLLQLGAKWDGSTLADMQTPYHIICQCPSDPYELLDMIIQSSKENLVNEKDYFGCTAVMYAVHNKNFECLRCLVAHGADLNIGNSFRYNNMTTPLIDAIRAHSSSPSPITRDILNLLLESAVDVNKPCHFGITPIKHAMNSNHMYCAKKIILYDAQINFVSIWFLAVSKASIDMLGFLLDLGIDKNCINSSGQNALYRAIFSGDITVIRYLLEAGVTITTKRKQPLYWVVTDLRTMNMQQHSLQWNACMPAISREMLDVVQLLEKYDQQTFQSIKTLQYAVSKRSLKIVNYLLSKYKYPLNMEYLDEEGGTYYTIITEACHSRQLGMVTLLMEHGADPAKKNDNEEYQCAFLIAIDNGYNELVAHFIRSGVSLDCRLHDEHYGDVLPFEYAVFRHNKQAAEMLLYAGSSCGIFYLIKSIITGINCSDIINDLQKFHSPELQKLVGENNVRPLDQLCRKSILKHLCPGAVKKITELPLPLMIIRYLSVPEIDNVLDECKKNLFYIHAKMTDVPRHSLNLH